jgi:hypothetical protein
MHPSSNVDVADMHPSSNVDVADMHTEKMMIKTKKMFYKYDSQLVPITEKDITIK